MLDYFQIDWWQVVPFVEAGRVGPDYDSDLCYKDLKWDVGLGIRAMAFRTVVQLDMAYGKEGAAAWAMIEQPFARQSESVVERPSCLSLSFVLGVALNSDVVRLCACCRVLMTNENAARFGMSFSGNHLSGYHAVILG